MKVCFSLLFNRVRRLSKQVALLLIFPFAIIQGAPPALHTEADSFSPDDHYVATSFFHWLTSNGGQTVGPWLPLEGRENWTGEPDWWKTQIKQVMAANIDVIYVHLIHQLEAQRVNLFIALDELRAEGYDTPKIAPFFDAQVIYNDQPIQSLAEESVKDDLVGHYIRFFEQYFDASKGDFADDYLARQDDKPILNTWHVKFRFSNVDGLTRTDLTNRLSGAFGSGHPYFNNGVVMVTTALNPPNFSFADEHVAQFEINEYFYSVTFNSITSVQLKPGYWDQNIRNPGSFLARDGGSHYRDAWDMVDRNSVQRIYIESWNEYAEGTGIYAADPEGSPYIAPENTAGNTDTWSSTNDPFEYIKTTASGAALFNETPELGASILWHNIPATLAPGEHRTAFIIVRNTGDASWTAASGYQLAQADADVEVVAGKRLLLDDTKDEIPVYGGIFRGRPKVFQVPLVAPNATGSMATHWQMLQEATGRFGEELAVNIEVKEKTTAIIMLGELSKVEDGTPQTGSFSTTPGGLDVELTYNGSPYPPVEPGSYTVVGTINDSVYTGRRTAVMVISPDLNLLSGPGGFERMSADAAATTPPDVVDTTTFPGWRFFNVDSANVSFSAEVTDHASRGSQALRISVNNPGGAFNYALDQWSPDTHTPVELGTNYIISYDAAWVEGVKENNLLFQVQEFDQNGNYLANGLSKVVSVGSPDYFTESVVYQPVHPDTAGVGLFFSPLRGAIGITTLDIDNVQMQVASPALNGNFELGPMVTAGGSEAFIDTTSFLGWRLFSVGSPAINSFTGSLVDAGTFTGGENFGRAIKLEVSNTGSSSAFDYGLDNDNIRVPVNSGETYSFSFDVALAEVIGGPLNFTASIAEFDGSGAFTGISGNFSPVLMEDQAFHHYSFDYEIANPATTQVVLAFRPATTGQSTLLVDNVTFSQPAEISDVKLQIAREGQTIQLSWPETQLGWQLQSNNVSLAQSDQWADIPGTESSINHSVSIDTETESTFYRLRSP